MLPMTSGTTLPDRSRLRYADEHLERALAGEAYLVLDGAMGSMLQREGLAAGELPELLCLSDPDAICAIHRAYVEAGSEVVTTNTFGASPRKLGGAATVEEVFEAAVACARRSGARYVAADVGPIGALLEPMGTMSFDEAYEQFAVQARAAEACGADLVIIETMTDLLEAKAAVLAAKENTALPILATMTFDETGRTFLGTDPTVAAITLSALGVQALGVNCSLGPDQLLGVVRRLCEVSRVPVVVQANAGLPDIVDGETVYSIGPDDYVAAVRPMIEAGVGIVGGCCGTDPDYIRGIRELVEERGGTDARPCRELPGPECSLASAQRSLVLRGRQIAVIGERINPTGKKRLKAALREGDYDYVLGEAISQGEAGADLLDVNCGLPEIDEPATMRELVKRIQGVSGLPLQIDSSDPVAIEAAVRAYSGKALINSVNGKRESLDAVLPIAAHYGCAVVGLTLDEAGIPDSAEERLAVARRIVEAAEARGIPRSDVYIDCLTMAASTNQDGVGEILRAVRMVREELGCRTVLGVSNISFGLPARPVVNATFLAAALSAGLDMPILNPLHPRYREVVDTWRVLCGQDEGARDYIAGYAGYSAEVGRAAGSAGGAAAAARPETAGGAPAADDGRSELYRLVIAGNRGPVAETTRAMLAETDAMELIDSHLIPALDEAGDRFGAGTFFLPQLMASAEAAKAAFDVIRSASGGRDAGKGPIAMATVKGDIHDIGKNIVVMLLENYGYRVIDLGRDVDPQAVVDCVRDNDVKIVGLSALMTTTVRSMEETIRLLREQCPGVRVMVGGAVLTQEYADMVGADFYAADAAESARYAEEVLG